MDNKNKAQKRKRIYFNEVKKYINSLIQIDKQKKLKKELQKQIKEELKEGDK